MEKLAEILAAPEMEEALLPEQEAGKSNLNLTRHPTGNQMSENKSRSQNHSQDEYWPEKFQLIANRAKAINNIRTNCWECGKILWKNNGHDKEHCDGRCWDVPPVRQSIETVLSQRGVHGEHLDKTLNNFNADSGHQKYVKVCHEFIKSSTSSLFLYGVPGCGKTHLAAGILREYALKGNKSFHSISTPKLMREIRSTFDNGNTTREYDIIDRLSRTGILVLDDLASENSTPYSIETLFLIIDERLSNGRKTVFTSNLNLDQIGEKLDERIASRLSKCMIVRIDMPDYRRRR